LNPTTHFDYIIIGAGVAGLQLALGLLSDSFFETKRILILDSHSKNKNDKTFSFWEEGKGKWESILHKEWNTAKCVSPTGKQLEFNFGNYTYKTIRSIAFYNEAFLRIENYPNVSFYQEKVLAVKNYATKVEVGTNKQVYTASKIFDSRIAISLEEIKKKSTYVNQSFLGYEVEMSTDVFSVNQCTMMDYSHQWKGSTSFIYILPYSKRKALIEYTFFAPFTPTKTIFQTQLENYISKKFKGISYNTLEIEYGEIPMTDYDFSKFNTPNIIKIGTAGGWVKPSSGYSFKATETYVSQIIAGLKKNKLAVDKPKRFKFYDRLLLSILKHDNKIGGKLFFEMYKRPNINLLFKFLDEKTSFLEEIKLILQLPYMPFIKALVKKR